MPVTLSDDLENATSNQRNYVRSMFERFGWKRLGGSVLRYDGRKIHGQGLVEDWLNDVVPAIMFFRSYAMAHAINIKRLTLDTMSVARLEPGYGKRVRTGAALDLKQPTNEQSSVKALRDFVDAAIAAVP